MDAASGHVTAGAEQQDAEAFEVGKESTIRADVPDEAEAHAQSNEGAYGAR